VCAYIPILWVDDRWKENVSSMYRKEKEAEKGEAVGMDDYVKCVHIYPIFICVFVEEELGGGCCTMCVCVCDEEDGGVKKKQKVPTIIKSHDLGLCIPFSFCEYDFLLQKTAVWNTQLFFL
jgi:hypothetical protein